MKRKTQNFKDPKFSLVVKYFQDHETGTCHDIQRYVEGLTECRNAGGVVQAALRCGTRLGILEPGGLRRKLHRSILRARHPATPRPSTRPHRVIKKKMSAFYRPRRDAPEHRTCRRQVVRTNRRTKRAPAKTNPRSAPPPRKKATPVIEHYRRDKTAAHPSNTKKSQKPKTPQPRSPNREPTESPVRQAAIRTHIENLKRLTEVADSLKNDPLSPVPHCRSFKDEGAADGELRHRNS